MYCCWQGTGGAAFWLLVVCKCCAVWASTSVFLYEYVRIESTSVSPLIESSFGNEWSRYFLRSGSVALLFTTCADARAALSYTVEHYASTKTSHLHDTTCSLAHSQCWVRWERTHFRGDVHKVGQQTSMFKFISDSRFDVQLYAELLLVMAMNTSTWHESAIEMWSLALWEIFPCHVDNMNTLHDIKSGSREQHEFHNCMNLPVQDNWHSQLLSSYYRTILEPLKARTIQYPAISAASYRTQWSELHRVFAGREPQSSGDPWCSLA